jgi:hypothetical protein
MPIPVQIMSELFPSNPPSGGQWEIVSVDGPTGQPDFDIQINTSCGSYQTFTIDISALPLSLSAYGNNPCIDIENMPAKQIVFEYTDNGGCTSQYTLNTWERPILRLEDEFGNIFENDQPTPLEIEVCRVCDVVGGGDGYVFTPNVIRSSDLQPWNEGNVWGSWASQLDGQLSFNDGFGANWYNGDETWTINSSSNNTYTATCSATFPPEAPSHFCNDTLSLEVTGTYPNICANEIENSKNICVNYGSNSVSLTSIANPGNPPVPALGDPSPVSSVTPTVYRLWRIESGSYTDNAGNTHTAGDVFGDISQINDVLNNNPNINLDPSWMPNKSLSPASINGVSVIALANMTLPFTLELSLAYFTEAGCFTESANTSTITFLEENYSGPPNANWTLNHCGPAITNIPEDWTWNNGLWGLFSQMYPTAEPGGVFSIQGLIQDSSAAPQDIRIGGVDLEMNGSSIYYLTDPSNPCHDGNPETNYNSVIQWPEIPSSLNDPQGGFSAITITYQAPPVVPDGGCSGFYQTGECISQSSTISFNFGRKARSFTGSYSWSGPLSVGDEFYSFQFNHNTCGRPGNPTNPTMFLTGNINSISFWPDNYGYTPPMLQSYNSSQIQNDLQQDIQQTLNLSGPCTENSNLGATANVNFNPSTGFLKIDICDTCFEFLNFYVGVNENLNTASMTETTCI